MPSKEKQVISSERERRWLAWARENITEIHNQVRGKLLTTLEVAITDSKQLEAFKSRVKDIQAQIWDRIEQDGYSIFSHRFTVSDQPRTTQSPTEKEFNLAISEFWDALENMIKTQFDKLKVITANLLTMAMDDQSKRGALGEEFGRIINDSSLMLRNWLSHGINHTLKVKAD